MFARIQFESEQIVTINELKRLEETLCDKVTFDECVQIVDTKEITTFHSWSHTYDELEESSKKLVIKDVNNVQLNNYTEYIVDLNTFLTRHPNLKIKLRGTIQTSESNLNGVVDKIQAAGQKLTDALKGFNEKVEFNQKCNVHIGNLGLLTINQVAYANDKCTEELQGLLNKGWRILSVCPQPDQRRPDYILGRYNEDSESDLDWKEF